MANSLSSPANTNSTTAANNWLSQGIDFNSIGLLIFLVVALLGFLYYRKRTGATWNIPKDVEGIAAFPWAAIGGIIGGIAAYLQAHDGDVPDYWSIWEMVFFGVIAALIGTFILTGTGPQKSIRCLTLGIIFGMVWPAVINLGESMALSKKDDQSTDHEHKVADKIHAMADSQQMDPTNLAVNPDKSTVVATIRSTTLWLITNMTLQESREDKRVSKQIIYESVDQLYPLTKITPDALVAWSNIRDEAHALRCDNVVGLMETLLPPSELSQRMADYQKKVTNATADYKNSHSTVTGWFRLANQEPNQTGFAGYLADTLDGANPKIHPDGSVDKDTHLILKTDVYLRSGPGDPDAAKTTGTTLMPAVCVMREGSEAVVSGSKFVDFITYKQVWIQISVAKGQTAPVVEADISSN